MTQFQFKRTGDDDYPRYLKILLQGPPKSGKTTFLATAPNVVVAAVEAGLMSIAHKDIPYVEVDGTDKLQSLQIILGDDAMRAQAARNLGLPKIETVAIDTLDAYQEMLKKEVMRENRRTSMQQADWGTLKERMAALLKAFVALPVNVIFTVHTTTSQDDEGRLIYTPNLQGSIKDDVAGFVDFSLLAFRQREVDDQGVPTINYYLKNEGDLKNPTLGNRAAGRVPEVCLPNFKVLHDAVFKGISRADPSQAPTEITVEVTKPVAAPQPAATAPVAQNASQPTGRPADDSEQPINASGITMLTKCYLAQGLVLPEDIKSWKLGKARQIAKFFQAWNTDKAAGQDPTREDLIAYLSAFDAFAGEMEGVQTGVENIASPPKPAVDPDQATTGDAPAEETPTPTQEEDDLPTEQAAIHLIETQLGGVQVGQEVSEDSKCEECGETIDDIDIARLAVTRYKRVLCIKDFKAANRAKA